MGSPRSLSHPGKPDGHPDLQGVWRNAPIVAAFNVDGQKAFYNEPGGASVIVDPPDGKLPYLPAALHRRTTITSIVNAIPPDIAIRTECRVCWCPPFPIEIVQDSNNVVLLSETEHSRAHHPARRRPHLKNIAAWGGDSRGRWEGDTLVVDVPVLTAEPGWIRRETSSTKTNTSWSGYTMTAPDTIVYEARVEDPTIYSRPWTLRFRCGAKPRAPS